MPTATQVAVDKPLTKLLISMEPTGFVAPQFLPNLAVPQQTGKYFIFDAERRALAESNDARTAGTKFRQMDFNATKETYTCDGHGLSGFVSDEEMAMNDAPISPIIARTRFLRNLMLVNQEIALKTILEAGVTQTSDPTNEWDDTTDGDIIADMSLSNQAIESGTGGHRATHCFMDSKVWDAVTAHPQVQGLILGGTSSDPSKITPDGFSRYFGLTKTIVGSAHYNTAAEGQTASLSRVWGSDVYLAYCPDIPALEEPSFGYNFSWDVLTGTSDWAVKTYYDKERHGVAVQVYKYYSQALTWAAAGYRLQNRLT